jgi:hypothetical protein
MEQAFFALRSENEHKFTTRRYDGTKEKLAEKTRSPLSQTNTLDFPPS